MNITEENIKKAIKAVKEQDNATLVYWWQCLSSGISTKAHKEMVKPLVEAINKERKKRGATTYKKSDAIVYE